MRNKLLALVCLLAILISSVAIGSTVSAATDRYQVGYAIREINPWVDPLDHSKGMLPVELTGNGNNWERVCDGLMDDNDDGIVGEGDGLFTTATAVTDPYGKTMFYITIDSLQGYSAITNDVRSMIVAALGINVVSPDQIMVNGNHTHSGPLFSSVKTSSEPGFKEYYQHTIQQIADAAVEAYNDRAEAVMTKGSIDAKDSTAYLGYNNGKGYHMNAIRHYDVTSKSKTSNSDIKQHVAGSNFGGMTTTMKNYKQTSRTNALESDNTLYVLLFEFPDNTDKEPVVFVNWRAHSTGNSGIEKTKVSADYANSIRANLRKAGYRPAFFQGASGNVVTTSTVVKDWEAECANGRDLNVYGRILSNVVLDCIERKMTEELPAGRIRNLQLTYHGELQKDSEGLLAAAKAYREGSAALGENKFLSTPYAYTHTDGKTYIINSKFHANSVVSRSTASDSYTNLELNVIIMGDNVAFVTAPNELADRYDLAGSTKNEDNDWLELINEATYGMPFVLGYTNDGRGYVPFSLEYTYNTDEYYEITGKGANGDEFHGAGSYEANTTRFARGTGEDIVQTFKKMLNSVDDYCYVARCEACQKDVEWKPVADAGAGQLNLIAGHYYLNEDLPMGDMGKNRVTVKDGNVLCLDLKGHKMETPSRSFYLEAKSTLNLLDSVGTGHVISYSGGNNVGGGAVSVASTATFNIYGGTLQFISQELPEGTYETGNGAVISCSGTTNMYGGTLIGGELVKSSYYASTSTTNGCGATVYLTGKLNVYGGRIIAGKAAEGARGDCVYVVNASGRVTVSGDAVIDEIYINDNSGSQLTVSGAYTGRAGVRFNPEKDTLRAGLDVGNSTNASLDNENLYCMSDPEYTIAVSGKNLVLKAWEDSAVAVVSDAAGVTPYTTLAAAVSNYDTGMITLLKDTAETVSISKDTYIDLNGCDITGAVTVADGKTLYGMDSKTDDYSVADGDYGQLSNVTGRVAGLPVESDHAIDGYLKITEDSGVSFHRVNLQLTAMTLRAEKVGVYYKSNFAGDELVAKNVKQFGVAVSIKQIPTEENLLKDCARSWFYGFAAGANSSDVTGTLVKGIMRQTNTEALNLEYAQMPIYGRAYILTNDGEYLFGPACARSFRQQMEDVNKLWSSLDAVQQQSVVALHNTYANVMSGWKISAIVTAATAPEATPEA